MKARVHVNKCGGLALVLMFKFILFHFSGCWKKSRHSKFGYRI